MSRQATAFVIVLTLVASPMTAPGQDEGPKGEANGSAQSRRERALGPLNRGNAARDAKDYDEAIAAYDEAIGIDPTLAAGFSMRGLVWAEKKEFDKAIADHTEAIRLMPNYAAGYIQRGIARQAKRENDAAIADYSEALRLNPRLTWALNCRGNAWAAKNDLDRALADYDTAIEIEPTNYVVYSNRSRLWRVRKDYARAIADAAESIRISESTRFNQRRASPYTFGHIVRGQAWLELKEFDRAMVDFNAAVQIDPQSPAGLIDRGMALRAKRDYAGALADFEAALLVEPKIATAQNNIAWLLATCPDESFRDGKRAVAVANVACEWSGWKDPNHLDTLAAAYAETGDFDRAVEWEEKAISMARGETSGENWKARVDLYRSRKPLRVD